MDNKKLSSIKRAQRESLLLKEISTHLLVISNDEPCLQSLAVNRVLLSPDKGLCTVFFYSPQGESAYQKLLPVLASYKPVVRKALAQSLNARYTPQLAFAYDTQFEKQIYIERLLDKIKAEDER